MIETPRLTLAPPRLADFEDSFQTAADPETARFIGGRPATREEHWTKFLRNIGHWTAFGYGITVVREKTGGAFVGEVGLAHFARGLGSDFDPYLEASWVLASDGRGKGYAHEAVAALHDWAIARTGAKRTVCIVNPANAPSLRLAEKLGYRQFGVADYRGDRPIMFERTL